MMMRRAGRVAVMATLAAVMGSADAQVRTIDPNQAIDRDLPPSANAAASRDVAARRARQEAASEAAQARPAATAAGDVADDQASDAEREAPAGRRSEETVPPRSTEPASERRADATRGADATFHRDDLIGAGEGVFGKGAQGFAGIIEKILKDQGEPNAYIAGREASGAFVVGLRYGSGIMTHKVEGQMPVYWTGPSVGFDFGGDANKVFVLVYNLYDTAQLYHRFPHGEGHLYFVGGFSATYLRWGHVVVIPVRLGVGVRAGVNVGYMKFTRKSKWLPF